MPAQTVIDDAPRAKTPARDPKAKGGSALRFAKRLLTLREGSVIVITIAVAAYFTATTEAFWTWENFKTLLPYFAPFAILAAGEVFLMINGEIDLSIGAVYLFTPFLFYEINNWGVALLPSLGLAMVGCMLVGAIKWAGGIVQADVTPNLIDVAPGHAKLPKAPLEKPTATETK